MTASAASQLGRVTKKPRRSKRGRRSGPQAAQPDEKKLEDERSTAAAVILLLYETDLPQKLSLILFIYDNWCLLCSTFLGCFAPRFIWPNSVRKVHEIRFLFFFFLFFLSNFNFFFFACAYSKRSRAARNSWTGIRVSRLLDEAFMYILWPDDVGNIIETWCLYFL